MSTAAAEHGQAGGRWLWAFAAIIALALHAAAILDLAAESPTNEGDDGASTIVVELGPLVTEPSDATDDLPPPAWPAP